MGGAPRFGEDMRIRHSVFHLTAVVVSFFAEPPAEIFEQYLRGEVQAFDVKRSGLTVSLLCGDCKWASDQARRVEQEWLSDLKASRVKKTSD